MEEVKSMEILQAAQAILIRHQVWPRKGAKTGRFFHFIKLGFGLLFATSTIQGTALHFVHTLATDTPYILYDLIDDLLFNLSGGGLLVLIVGAAINCNIIQEVISILSNFEEFGKPPTIDDINHKLNIYTKSHYWYSVGVAVAYCSVDYLFGMEECEAKKAQYNVDKICGLSAGTFLPFEVSGFPRLHIFLLLQIVSTMYMVTTSTISMAVMLGILEIFITRINHFKAKLDCAFTSGDNNVERKHLTFCIKYHIHIIKINRKINGCFSKVMLFYITVTAVIISIIGLQILISNSTKPITHMSLWLINLLIPCMAGQRLINASETIPQHIYATQWYNYDISLQKDVGFMILRSNKFMFLDAEGFSYMSSATYSAVIQTSYSYLALLHQTFRAE